MSVPSVSVIVPTYNRRPVVLRALASILSQGVPFTEILVVDDGSTDGTAEALAAEFGDAITVIRQDNAGVSAARRAGVLGARGDWIAFLDSDDTWTPGRAALFNDAIARTPPDVAWFFGDTVIVGDGAERPTLFTEYGLALTEDLQVFDDALPTQFPFQFSLLQSSLIRRDALIEAGAFAENLRGSEDFLVSFRTALRHRMAALRAPVTNLYRTSDLAGSSLAGAFKQQPDFYRARMLAFTDAIAAGRPGDWARRHADAVRSLCLALHRAGKPGGRTWTEQFRHGASPKSLAFAGFAMLGRPGFTAWTRLAGAPQALPQWGEL